MPIISENGDLCPFKWDHLEEKTLTPVYKMPVLPANPKVKPRNLIPFNYARSEKEPGNKWVCFYIHDYQFERLWNDPDKYLPILKRFEGCVSPDFSVLLDQPRPEQMRNLWRNKALAYWMSNNRIPVAYN